MKKKIFFLSVLICIFHFNSFGIDFKRTLAFGNDENKDYLFFKPGPLVVDKNGNIFVVEGETQVIRKYNKVGVFIKSVGKKGQGPQEFTSITSIFLQGNFLFVYDFINKRLTKFNLDLGYVESRPVSKIGLFVAANQEYIITNKKKGNGNEIAIVKPFEEWEKIVYPGDDFGKYDKYRNTPMFSAFLAYQFSVDEKSGAFVSTLWYPLTEEPQLTYFDKNGALMRKVKVKLIPVNYELDERLFDMTTFKQAKDKKLTIGRIFFINKNRTAFIYAYGSKKEDNETGLIFVDNFSGKIVMRYKNKENFDICFIRDDHAYGFLYDDEGAGMKIGVYKLNW
jgi:hypothetical protein